MNPGDDKIIAPPHFPSTSPRQRRNRARRAPLAPDEQPFRAKAPMPTERAWHRSGSILSHVRSRGQVREARTHAAHRVAAHRQRDVAGARRSADLRRPRDRRWPGARVHRTRPRGGMYDVPLLVLVGEIAPRPVAIDGRVASLDRRARVARVDDHELAEAGQVIRQLPLRPRATPRNA